jgi:hypothetical protein
MAAGPALAAAKPGSKKRPEESIAPVDSENTWRKPNERVSFPDLLSDID